MQPIFIAHTGDHLSPPPSPTANEALAQYIFAKLSIEPENQILLTERGRVVKPGGSIADTSIFLFDKTILARYDPADPAELVERVALVGDGDRPDGGLSDPPPGRPSEREIESLAAWKDAFVARQDWAAARLAQARALADTAVVFASQEAAVKWAGLVAVLSQEGYVRRLESKGADVERWFESVELECGDGNDDTSRLDRLRPIRVRAGPDRLLFRPPADLMISAPAELDIAEDGTTSLFSFVRSWDMYRARQAVTDARQTFRRELDNALGQIRSVATHTSNLVDQLQADVDSQSHGDVMTQADGLVRQLEAAVDRSSVISESVIRQPSSIDGRARLASESLARFGRIAAEQEILMATIVQLHRHVAAVHDNAGRAREDASEHFLGHMHVISKLQSDCDTAKAALRAVVLPASGLAALGMVAVVRNLPRVWGRLLIEAVRRAEWDRIVVDAGSAVRDEVATGMLDEASRRRRWHAGLCDFLDRNERDDPDRGMVQSQVIVEEPDGPNPAQWPDVGRDDMADYIEQLEQMTRELGDVGIELRLLAVTDLDVSAAAASRVFVARREVDAMIADRAELEDDVDGQRSRVRRLEDLLHRVGLNRVAEVEVNNGIVSDSDDDLDVLTQAAKPATPAVPKEVDDSQSDRIADLTKMLEQAREQAETDKTVWLAERDRLDGNVQAKTVLVTEREEELSCIAATLTVRDEQIADLSHRLATRDIDLAGKDSLLLQKDAELAEKDKQISDLLARPRPPVENSSAMAADRAGLIAVTCAVLASLTEMAGLIDDDGADIEDGSISSLLQAAEAGLVDPGRNSAGIATSLTHVLASIRHQLDTLNAAADSIRRDALSRSQMIKQARRESASKLAFRNFRVGDLALFLPGHGINGASPGSNGNQAGSTLSASTMNGAGNGTTATTAPATPGAPTTPARSTAPTVSDSAGGSGSGQCRWMAFHVGTPPYFLHPAGHSLGGRQWMVGRVKRIREFSRRPDLAASSQVVSPVSPSATGPTSAARWYVIEAVEEKTQAPATPGTSLSSVQTSIVGATGRTVWKGGASAGSASAVSTTAPATAIGNMARPISPPARHTGSRPVPVSTNTHVRAASMGHPGSSASTKSTPGLGLSFNLGSGIAASLSRTFRDFALGGSNSGGKSKQPSQTEVTGTALEPDLTASMMDSNGRLAPGPNVLPLHPDLRPVSASQTGLHGRSLLGLVEPLVATTADSQSSETTDDDKEHQQLDAADRSTPSHQTRPPALTAVPRRLLDLADRPSQQPFRSGIQMGISASPVTTTITHPRPADGAGSVTAPVSAATIGPDSARAGLTVPKDVTRSPALVSAPLDGKHGLMIRRSASSGDLVSGSAVRPKFFANGQG